MTRSGTLGKNRWALPRSHDLKRCTAWKQVPRSGKKRSLTPQLSRLNEGQAR